MKRFLFKWVWLTVGMIVIASIADYCISRYLKQVHAATYEIWNDILQPHPAADLVFMGNSRAITSLVPDVVDSLLGTCSWNLGVLSAHIQDEYYRYAAFRRFNPPPRVLLQVVDFFFLDTLPDPFLTVGDCTLISGIPPFVGLSSLTSISRYGTVMSRYSVIGGQVRLSF